MLKKIISNRNFKKGELLFSQKDYKNAAEYFRKAAEDGHADAQFKFGILHGKGLGVAKNKEESLRWLGKAAGQGHAGAKKELGLIKRGEEITEEKIKPEDQEESLVSIRYEAENGNPEMQYQLGKIYCNGTGVQQDYAEAVKWTKMAAEQRHVLGQYNMGHLYLFGKGVEKDSKEAMRWFKKAAEQGDIDAQYTLGVAYCKGDGVERDYNEAAKRFRKAAEHGHIDAQCLLGALYNDGKGVKKDDHKAVEWYRKAAEQGDAGAQYNLGIAYFIGKGVTGNFTKAVEWFDKAVEQGEENAISKTEEIRKEIIKNAEVGNVAAQSTLAKLYLQGSFGLPQDVEKAVTWLRLAAEQGDEDCQYNLVQLLKLLGNARIKGSEIKLQKQISQSASISQGEPPDDLMGLYLYALKEKNEGNFEKAIVIWKKILEKDFRRLNAINAIACAYAETGELHKAKRYIDMAMKVGGEEADFVRSNLAGILYDTGKFKEAEEILNAIECKDLRIIDNITRVLVAQGKSERALELIEEFLVKEGVPKTTGNYGERCLQEIITRGIHCMLQCKPTEAVDFLETYAHILPPEPLSAVYFNAGIYFLQEENDGVCALKCLSEAVRNKPDDSEAKEALSDAALNVIADFGGQGKISENEKAALATAYETVGNRKKALEIKKQIVSVENGEKIRPTLGVVNNETKTTTSVIKNIEILYRKIIDFNDISVNQNVNSENFHCECCDIKNPCIVRSDMDPINTCYIGDEESDILLVGEAPSAEEGLGPIISGRFDEIKPSDNSPIYKVRDFIKEYYKMTPYFTDLIKCGFPKQEKKDGLNQRKKNCFPYLLLQEIKYIKPRYIFCVGVTANNTITSKYNKKLILDIVPNVKIVKLIHYCGTANHIKIDGNIYGLDIEKKYKYIWPWQSGFISKEEMLNKLVHSAPDAEMQIHQSPKGLSKKERKGKKDNLLAEKHFVSEERKKDKRKTIIPFWVSLLELAKLSTNLHANVKPSERPYVIARVKKYLEFNYVALKNGARVDLYINSGDKAKNKAIYDSLFSRRDQVQEVFGDELKWERLDDKDACRVSKSLNVGSYKNRNRWPEIQKSMVDAMVRFEAALKPSIETLSM